jgi:DNA-binding response OmpR family regulator
MMASLAASARRPEANPLLRGQVLLVGDPSPKLLQACGQLEPRGYALTWAGGLSPRPPIPKADVVLFSTHPNQAQAVIEHCRRLRRARGPALMVLHWGCEPEFVIEVLEAGADDCLVEPSNPFELLTRVRAVLRGRAARHPRARRRFVLDGHELDSVRLSIRAPDGRHVEITPMQHRLLLAMLERPGEVLSREELLIVAHGELSEAFDRAIDTHISRLRKRLVAVGAERAICACRGGGYRLQAVRAR